MKKKTSFLALMSGRNAIRLLILTILSHAPLLAVAQDCSAHASAHRSYYLSGKRTPITPDQASKDVRDRINDGYYITYCPREWGARCTIGRRGTLPTAPNYREVLLLFADIMDVHPEAKVGDPYYPWLACLARQQAAQLTPRSTPGPVGKPAVATSPAPSPAPNVASARPSSSGSAGAAGPPTTREAVERAQAQARQRQAALDEQRRGRPKRHYADREAHHCLRLVTENTNYGGFTNTCSFPVRFSYCAYKPRQGAWTESFNCETGSFGGHALITPGGRSSHHTLGAQKVFFYACRADSSSDEIFEVGDAEFDASVPGIRARCVKWGDRS